MIKGFYKVFSFFICLCLLVVPLSIISKGETVDLRGDLNSDKAFNTIDMVVLRRYFMYDSPIEFSNYSADLNIDGMVDVRDLVRMKKYFVGSVVHSNRTEDDFVWLIVDGDDNFVVPTTLLFEVHTHCTIETQCLPGRYTSEITCYVQTLQNPNPEWDDPDLEIGITTINGKDIELYDDINVITAPNTLWCNKISNQQFDVSELSNFSCIFIGMQKQSLFAYQQTVNEFDF